MAYVERKPECTDNNNNVYSEGSVRDVIDPFSDWLSS